MSLLTDAPNAVASGKDLARESAESRAGAGGAFGPTLATSDFSARPGLSPRSRLAIMVGLSVTLALAAGGYFWWQLDALAGSALAPAVPVDKALAQAAPALRAPLAQPASSGPAALREQARPGAARTIEVAAPPAVAASPAALRAASSEEDAKVSIRPGRREPPGRQAIALAYTALRAGRFAEAQRQYEEVLRGDGRNVDALLGLATIAAREGRPEQAQAFYALALEADPNDATALAAVSGLQADAEVTASRLKSLIASRPDAAAAHFALGNLYAAASRWSEAQQAFFNAHALDPANADLSFNLAVSLDHLHQGKLALDYYRQALANAAAGDHAFEPAQARQRVAELER